MKQTPCFGTAPLNAAPSPSIDDKVCADRLHLLFRQSPVATLGSLVAACLLAWLQWHGGNIPAIKTWLVVLGGASLLRLSLFYGYYRSRSSNSPEPLDAQRWERLYWPTLLVSASAWGLGALWIMSADDLLSQAITLFFAIGMAGGAASSYSAYRSMTLTAVALVLLPSAGWLLLQPSPTQRGLALAALLFAASVFRTTRNLSDALQTALRLGHEMEQAHSIAAHAAQTDMLTGLNNRRAFHARAEQLQRYCRRNRLSLCALVLDIDHFKTINDRHGHHTGDEVLRRVGALLQAGFRASDVCGRLGGEEFAVLLPDTPSEAAMGVAELLRAKLAGLELALPDGGCLRISASIGLATTADGDEDLPSLLQRADAAMYRAKDSGRDQIASGG